MTLLQTLLKIRGVGSTVGSLLDEQLMIEAYESKEERKKGVFHPSEICREFCPRAWLLEQYMPDKVEYRTSVADEWIYSLGDCVHDLVEGLLIRTGKVVGEWKCFDCGKRVFGFKPKKCGCGSEGFKYVEVPVMDDEVRIGGHADAVLSFGSENVVVEVKSCKQETFNSLVSPLSTNKMQAMIYVDVLERMRLKVLKKEVPDTSWAEDEYLLRPFSGAFVLYVNRNMYGIKEYFVKYDGEVRTKVESLRKVLKKTLDYFDEGKVPERLDVCSFDGSPRSKRCSMRRTCFQFPGDAVIVRG